MPFTLAHPAATLPLRRLGLPMTALALGSMVPDAPLYLGSRRGYDVTHHPLGVLTVDVVLTLLALVVWFAAVRDPLVDLAPDAVRSRLPPRVRFTRRQWWLAAPAGCTAAVTHVVWDSFTHADSWGARQVAWIQADHLGLAGIRWMQYGSAILGLGVVGAAALAHLRSLEPLRIPRSPRVLPRPGLPVVLAAIAVAGVGAALTRAGDGVYSIAFRGAVTGGVAAAVLLAALCLTWHLVARRTAGLGEQA